MRIDLTCPAELRDITLPADGGHTLSLLLGNLSGKTIVSAQLTVRTFDRAGEPLEEIEARARDLDGRPAALFRIPVELRSAAPRSAEAVIERLWFSDSSVWRRGNFPLTEYTPNDLPDGHALTNLRFLAGADAVGYPREESEYWLCVCGRPNASYTDSCDRCRRSRAEVFRSCSAEAVEQAIDLRRRQLELQSRTALENTSGLQLEREKVWRRKRKLRRRILGAAGGIALAAGLACAAIFLIAPAVRYSNATAAMERGDYAAAETAFAAMGDYRDAPAKRQRSRFLAAEAAVKSGDEQQVRAAREVLTELTDEPGAQDLLEQAELRLVRFALDGGRTAEAETLLRGLTGTEADALTDELHYKQAEAALSAGDFAGARALFAALGSYRDAPARLQETGYRAGLAALEGGDARTAIDELQALPGYQDADAQLLRAWYARGEELEAAGDPVAAGRAFLQAGNTVDAPARAAACIRPAADAAYEKHDWPTATDLYSLIKAEPGANDRYRAAAYAWAQQAINISEYNTASELLAELPDDYEETLELRQESAYQPALTALESGDWQTAIEGFSRISTYRDSSERLAESRYWLAMQKIEQGAWADAVPLLEQAGSYSDAARKLEIARYNLAAQMADAGQLAEAEALYTQLGTYRDAAGKAKETAYRRAEALRNGADAAGARALFLSLGDFSDAAAQADACACLLAADLEKQGDRAAAAAAYAAVTDSPEAQVEARRLYGILAAETEAAGQIVPAGRLWLLAGETEKAEACFDAYYGEAARAAQACLAEGDYPMVITLLRQLDLTNAPAQYAALTDAWNEANYALALAAEERGDRMAALPYWQAIPGYRDADTRLQRACYGILGKWQTADGAEYDFRADGTCTMDGTPLYYNAEGNALWTGESPDALRRTHTIAELTETSLGLRIIGSRKLTLTRTAPAALPEAAAPASPATATDLPAPATATDWLVREEED